MWFVQSNNINTNQTYWKGRGGSEKSISGMSHLATKTIKQKAMKNRTDYKIAYKRRGKFGAI